MRQIAVPVYGIVLRYAIDDERGHLNKDAAVYGKIFDSLLSAKPRRSLYEYIYSN